MALTIACDTNGTLGLEDYMAYVEDKVNIRDEDSLADSAIKLRQLANDPDLVVSQMNRELDNWTNFQTGNNYTSQTVLLGRGKNFFIRANLWLPPATLPQDQEWLDQLFFYRIPHDHNFSFLTVGYFGSGYETTIWEYARDGIKGEPGEAVGLRFLERTSLPKGKVMLYRACRDIHSQEHPQDCSISINLIVGGAEEVRKDQYLFDVEAGRISANIRQAPSQHIFLCSVAQHIGNAATASALEKVSQTHASPKVRVAAASALAALEPVSARNEVWQSLLPDKDESVRRSAAQTLNGENPLKP